MERYQVVTCCVCVTSCIFMVLGCIYVTSLVREVRDLRAQCVYAQDALGRTMQKDADMQTWRDPGELQSPNYELKFRQKRMVPDHGLNARTRHKRKTPKNKNKKSKLKAGHYVSMATDEYVKKNLGGYGDKQIKSDHFSITASCGYIKEMKGVLCRSKDFFVNNTEGVLHVFKPSTWTNKKLAPFTLKENGEFHAKTKGVYFVYAQVLFNDNKYEQTIVLRHKAAKTKDNARVLSCTISGGGPGSRGTYNTCNMQGLVFLNKKDVLTIENLMHDVKLHMRQTTTYFGAFLLK